MHVKSQVEDAAVYKLFSVVFIGLVKFLCIIANRPSLSDLWNYSSSQTQVSEANMHWELLSSVQIKSIARVYSYDADVILAGRKPGERILLFRPGNAQKYGCSSYELIAGIHYP